MGSEESSRAGRTRRGVEILLLVVFLGAAAYLFNEHREHLLAAVPYLSLFICIALVVVVWRALAGRPDAGGSNARSSKPRKGGLSDEP